MLEYAALFLLFFVAIVGFYGIIAIHDIPYEMAKKRNHPQQDAIHVAGWVSLFTLHILWPFLWIWATLYREDRGWGFTGSGLDADNAIGDSSADLAHDAGALRAELTAMSARLAALEKRLER